MDEIGTPWSSGAGAVTLGRWWAARRAARRARRMDWVLRNLNLVRHKPCGKFLIDRPSDPDIQRLIRTELDAFNGAICTCESGRFVVTE